jgi:hypothetical protein
VKGGVNFRVLILIAALPFVPLHAAELKPETSAAFDRYIKVTEDEMNQHLGFGDFLWMDRHIDKKSVVWLGQSTIIPQTTLEHGQAIEVPDGVIQHWLGLVYLEKATLDKVSTALQNFNEYHNMIPLQIMDSKTTKHEGDHSEAFLRLFKKQVSAVVLNVKETATYKMLDPSRAVITCRSTHIGEVERPKDKKRLDEEREADDSAGYLWRMNTYLRMEQADNGVYVEIEMITLARQTGGLINTSRFLTGFQSFPHELTQGFIAALEYIYPNKR